MSSALILVDIQNDFLPGGALAVPDGDAVITIANSMIPKFAHVYATQDWHPANHGSFASQHSGAAVFDEVDLHGLPQTLWPDHCIQNTPGADFAAALALPNNARIFPKGTDATIDSYSGFFDNGKKKSTGLADDLRDNQVDEVFVMGLATDYCVKFTALDAIHEGFKTTLIEDGCRGVCLQPGDIDRAVEEMRAAGITVQNSHSLAGR